ncbi:amino acid/amide ABC transporter ATP-binding protein 1 (HAAT family) [Stella humosa]|uniref:Amino acid/amide ABC transporter ATP-binding protein 1 (HAAT family) n=1 Tax=Stella humosa TaxID=94 RepID=A0A3N1KQC4_9PROT|nr:ABC transporter ATP-binding protein [Stella humosa]ROP84003.1 amino acid/amide ABC transporter ATP-binding protein 1 (HAAT family) [Stella humosa]BBK33512.1 ABC transporter ATP-binding protein [Stella humosa]
MTLTPAIRIENVSRRFGALQAVQGVSLDVMPGERRAILGPNGAGKTTLFNTICGDFPPTEGRIALFGQDITRLTPHRRARLGIGRTYQTSLLFDGLTVLDNLFLAVRGVKAGRFSMLVPRRGDPDRAEAEAIAQRMRLGDCIHRGVRELSHGQRRQLEVGMALAGKPRVLMLDEPAAGLSPGDRPKLLELLRELPRDLTLILIEHDMDIALPTADIVTVMKDGQVVVEATPDRIATDPVVQAIYLGGGH